MMQRLIIISSTVFGTLIAVHSVQAQIIPDGTTNTSVINNCQAACDLTGGTVAGENLFHSFQEFNLAPEARVYFDDPGVANIFSRITGSNPSEIFGTLGVKGGDANLFLLNPNGIVFGEGAALDLNGSFFATTADEIQFGDRNFSAIPSDGENLALLTVNPSALLFTQMNKAGAINLDGADLTTVKEQNIALLGRGNNNPGVELKNSTIDATEGNISLGAVNGNAEIALIEDRPLEFPPNAVRGDISIVDGSQITTTNLDNLTNTAIKIDSNNFSLSRGSKISTLTNGIEEGIKGANIAIDAQTSVTITGEDSIAFQTFVAENLILGGNANLSNGLETTTLGGGNAGDIEIITPNLTIDRGAGIISITRNQGNSGNINLDIAKNMRLIGSGLLTGSGTRTVGNVGEINIATENLVVEQNSAISSSTLGAGDAGSLSIIAFKAIEIKDTSANAIIPTGVFTNTIFENGRGGNLHIDTPRLILQNGGQLSASSGAVLITENGLDFIRSGGEGGNIDLTIESSLLVQGTSVDGAFPSSILSDTRTASSAGNVTIQTGDLSVDSGGLISASSLGSGIGGNITIDARNSVSVHGAGTDNLRALILDGLRGRLDSANVKGAIAAFTIGDGEAGSILIDTNSLNLDRGGVISTATYGNNNAGDLTINASEIINVKSSAIISPTFGAGDGGNINLKTKNLNITGGGGVVSASSSSGLAGDIGIVATESIALLDVIPRLPFSGSISTGNYRGEGLSGNLTIDTQRLSIKGGANIETNNTFIDFDQTGIIFDSIDLKTDSDKIQGKLTINATESIEISGSIAGENSFTLFPNSHIHSITNTSNPASNVKISTSKLSISDGGEISVRSLGLGAAGTLEINADSISLRNQGSLNSTTVSGRGGNIDLQVEGILTIDDRSLIDTNASQGNGGNIDIAADFVIARFQSSIAAKALDEGIGGNIRIQANDIFLTADSSINADSAFGVDGTVKVETLFNTERNNLTQLPQQVVRADSKITRSCSNNGDRQGIFSYTGRGGLPFNPLTDFQTDDIIIADLDIPTQTEAEQIQPEVNSKLDLLQARTVEADRWQVNPNGKIELTASDNSTIGFAAFYCPLSNPRT